MENFSSVKKKKNHTQHSPTYMRARARAHTYIVIPYILIMWVEATEALSHRAQWNYSSGNRYSLYCFCYYSSADCCCAFCVSTNKDVCESQNERKPQLQMAKVCFVYFIFLSFQFFICLFTLVRSDGGHCV